MVFESSRVELEYETKITKLELIELLAFELDLELDINLCYSSSSLIKSNQFKSSSIELELELNFGHFKGKKMIL